MQYREGIRRMGRVGACLAFASSILMFAGPAAATAQEVAAVDKHNQDRFFVHLTGGELEDGGDRGGRGAAGLDFDLEHERACYVVSWQELRGAVTAFPLHAAPRRSDGPQWIDLFNDRHFDGERGTVSSCVNVSRQKMRAVMHYPSEFYLTIRTTAHKAGAVRGQLG